VKHIKITERYTVRGTISMDSYLREVEKTKPMTADKEYEVACKAQQGDEKAMEMLVKSNLRFVISVAKKYSRDPDTVLDLISTGNIGLIDAAKKFDPTKGFKFISFAVWHIRKEMLDYMVKNSRTIRLPQSQIGILTKINEIRTKYYNQEGGEPTDEEILAYVRENYKTAENLQMSHLKEIMQNDASTYSLDKPMGDNEETTILDVYDSGENPTDDFIKTESLETTIRQLMEPLSWFEQQVVKRRHGVGYIAPQEFSSIGEELEYSAERIRQIYRKSLRKMKVWAKRRNISLDGIL
jgi:RNA polymerase primary sigma factor